MSGCIRYTAVNSSVSEYGTRKWSVSAPGMPLMTSLLLMRPHRFLAFSPARPHQLTIMAFSLVGWAMIAGVHSTVWIFAMSAALMSRARWYSWSSVHVGYSALSRSQIALCSFMNSVCSSARPSQKLPATSAMSSPSCRSAGGSPSGPIRSLPSSFARTLAANSGLFP
jgi:hypothetical protein